MTVFSALNGFNECNRYFLLRFKRVEAATFTFWANLLA